MKKKILLGLLSGLSALILLTGCDEDGGDNQGDTFDVLLEEGATDSQGTDTSSGTRVVTDAANDGFTNFESPHTNPVRLSPDGSRLFVVNRPGGRLSVFSLDQPWAPERIAEIPVGLEPVSVVPVSNEQAWVVNHVSGTVTVVDVSRGIVVATLDAGVEPSDAIAPPGSGKVFVTASRDNAVHVFDRAKRTRLSNIQLEGEHPRALAASPDGAKVYTAFAVGGNGTTIWPRRENPPWTPEDDVNRDDLPPTPEVGLIVDSDNPDRNDFMDFELLEHDVAEIDVATGGVRYFSETGTVNFNVTVRPSTGNVFVPNIESENLKFFMPKLFADFTESRITQVVPDSGTAGSFNINGTDASGPFPREDAIASALAHPTELEFDPSGDFFWVAAFGTDRIARIEGDGTISARIPVGDVEGAETSSATKRGPRDLAVSEDGRYLYVMNSISNTVSVIEAASNTVVNEFPVGTYDPMPSVERAGRGFFYNARLSGTGEESCASCHIDGRTDNLAWNMGEPEGQMRYVTDPVTGEEYGIHPLKGPLVTPPLAGLDEEEAFHWRGELPDLNAFNALYEKLMGNSRLAESDMDDLATFIREMEMYPNPYRQLDGSLPASLNGYDPANGRHTFDSGGCTDCHQYPEDSTRLHYVKRPNGSTVKVDRQRNLYKKSGYDNRPGARSTIGFGVLRDGGEAPVLDSDRRAFLYAWDNGTAPTVGHMFTVDDQSAGTVSGEWSTLESGAKAGDNGIVIHGIIEGMRRGLVYEPAEDGYRDCGTDNLRGRAALREAAADGRARFTVLGLPVPNTECARVY